jgi:hypothetical protein
MDENKVIDIFLIITFIAGIAGLGLFFFTNPGKPVHSIKDTLIEQKGPDRKSGHSTSQDIDAVSEPKEPEDGQIKNGISTPESSPSTETKIINEKSSARGGISVSEQKLLNNKEVAASPSENKEDSLRKEDESKEISGTITPETEKGNGTISSAQEIPGGVVAGKKADATDRADIYRVRATGPQMTLLLEPDVVTVKGRSVMTIYDSQLKGVGEYFPQNKSRRTFQVKEREIYYIKLHLSSIDNPSFEYRLKIEFQSASHDS